MDVRFFFFFLNFSASCKRFPFSAVSLPTLFLQIPLSYNHWSSWEHCLKLSIEEVSLGLGIFESYAGERKVLFSELLGFACQWASQGRVDPGVQVQPSAPYPWRAGALGGGGSSSPLSPAPVPDFLGSCGAGREGAPVWASEFEWESRLWRRRPALACASRGLLLAVARSALLGGFSVPRQGFRLGSHKGPQLITPALWRLLQCQGLPGIRQLLNTQSWAGQCFEGEPSGTRKRAGGPDQVCQRAGGPRSSLQSRPGHAL